MSYEIEDVAPKPRVVRSTGHLRRRTGMPKPVAKAIDEYVKAYYAVYYMKPSVRYDRETGFVYVANSGGVSVKRLKELTKALEYRK